MVEAGRKDACDAASSSVVVVGGGAAEASGVAIVADTDSYSVVEWTAATHPHGEIAAEKRRHPQLQRERSMATLSATPVALHPWP